jgi:hypothetical protein
MNREECLKIVAIAREKGGALDLNGVDLRGADLRWADLRRADLSGANLRRADLRWANLRGADLNGACLDFASWPLWCGGTQVNLDRHLYTQLIYHVFNQTCDDPEIIAALEPLRALAQEFVDKHRQDAPALRPPQL